MTRRDETESERVRREREELLAREQRTLQAANAARRREELAQRAAARTAARFARESNQQAAADAARRVAPDQPRGTRE